MFTFLRAFVRLSVGVWGCLLCLSGLAALMAGIVNHFRAPLLDGTSNLLIGCCLAYGAFVRAPWERREKAGSF